MGYTLKNTPTLIIAGMLCAAFALGGCSNNDIPLPARGSAEARALHEQCLKTLPPDQADKLKQTSRSMYPSEFAKYNELLQSCVKLQNENPEP